MSLRIHAGFAHSMLERRLGSLAEHGQDRLNGGGWAGRHRPWIEGVNGVKPCPESGRQGGGEPERRLIPLGPLDAADNRSQ